MVHFNWLPDSGLIAHSHFSSPSHSMSSNAVGSNGPGDELWNVAFSDVGRTHGEPTNQEEIGKAIQAISGLNGLCGIATAVDGFEHLWTNEGAELDDHVLERDHMAKMGGS
ncbi:hypothetical protein BC826DRAFT_1183931 [Russula brevipes]|nr:hypothetical protein BC826DRAFT_1183931 [Russula brevipes]